MNFLRRLMGLPPEPPTSPVHREDTMPLSEPKPTLPMTQRDTKPLPPDPASDLDDTPTPPLRTAEPDEASTSPLTAVPASGADKPRMIDLGDQNSPVIDASESALDGVTRPLPQEVVIEVSGAKHAIFGQATDLGRVRTNNEDSVYSFFATGRSAEGTPDFGLFVVADGMGGHSEGERASAIAVRTVAVSILRDIYLPLFNHENRDAPIAEVVTSAVQRANDAVVKDLDDGGTTVSAAVLIGDLAYIGHVGDSRVYMISRGKIERVTRDHSWVQRLIELDQLTPDEASEHPQKNLLYRALGQSDTLEVDTLMRRMPPNARLLLCSDGLWNQVEDADILRAVNDAASPQEACAKLIAMANANGGPDNISVIMLQLPG